MTDIPPVPPHVVMLVANDVTADTRVRKTALTVAAAGLRVTVVGYASAGTRTESWMGPVRIIRVPSRFVVRDHRGGRGSALPLGYRSKQAYVVAQHLRKVRERDVAAAVTEWKAALRRQEAGPDRPLAAVTRRALQLRIRTARLSLKAHRKVSDVRGGLYRRRTRPTAPDAPADGTALGRVARAAWRAARSAPGPWAGWRRLHPELHDFELAFGPVLDELAPDVIHAHDFAVIGIAARAAARQRAGGRDVRWIYDAHEYVRGLPYYGPAQLRAWRALEAEYIRRADRVITVSEPLADRLAAEHRLARRPAVVLNAPSRSAPAPHAPSVRLAAGIPDGVPIAVYSGTVTAQRGLATLVGALARLPELHVVLVSRPGRRVQEVMDRAEELGCAQRLHVVGYARPEEVASYLASATLGVCPLVHCGNHEVALPNKLFEYLHAHLPVVVSDVEAMAAFVRTHGVGAVFRAEDDADLARAISDVLDDRDAHVGRITPALLERYSWEGQEPALLAVYGDLLGLELSATAGGDAGGPGAEGRSHEAGGRRAAARQGAPSLGIGPRNMAGQGMAWAGALRSAEPAIRTEVFAWIKEEGLRFPCDRPVPARSWSSLEWQLGQVRHVVEQYTHLLLEAGGAACGTLNGGYFHGDLPLLRAHGIQVGLVFHGSEVRDPRVHRLMEPWSPFGDPADALTARLQAQVDDLLPHVAAFDGPRYVTTMDLLDHVPDARWLPVVVDPDVWRGERVPLERARPVVVHAPSHTVLKGSLAVDAVAEELAARGVIEYRRLRDVPPDEMPAALAGADIVLDQFALGDYGVLACQAMAAGRVVVGHVADRVRKRLPAELPIVQATPADLRDVLLRVVEERDAARATAAEGVEFVRAYHDGRHAVAQLRPFLTGEGS